MTSLFGQYKPARKASRNGEHNGWQNTSEGGMWLSFSMLSTSVQFSQRQLQSLSATTFGSEFCYYMYLAGAGARSCKAHKKMLVGLPNESMWRRCRAGAV